MKTTHPHNRLIADIEEDEENCVNHEMRKRRELFYLHDDFKETNIRYTYKGVDYILLSANGMINKKEFLQFWSHFAKCDDLGYYLTHHLAIKK